MSFIKQESEISNNDSDFNLHAVNIELDSLKIELVSYYRFSELYNHFRAEFIAYIVKQIVTISIRLL